MAVDPKGADLKRYLAEDPGGPVVMLNLLRFRPDGGRESYQRYVDAVGAVSARHGVQITYLGEGGRPLAAEEGQAWDMVLLVRYPSREHFAAMIRDPRVPGDRALPRRGARGGGPPADRAGHGSGMTTVLVHGNPKTAAVWDPLL